MCSVHFSGKAFDMFFLVQVVIGLYNYMSSNVGLRITFSIKFYFDISVKGFPSKVERLPVLSFCHSRTFWFR